MNFGSLPLVRPMLAVNSEPFDSESHLFEIKWDGYRGLAYLDEKTVIRSRNLIELSERFPELSGVHRKVKKLPAILDGEIVVFEKGRPSFNGLQSRGRMNDAKRIGLASLECPAVFIVFDILYSAGKNIMNMPLCERKKLLQDMVQYGDDLSISTFIIGDGKAFFNACVKEGLEGVVAKKLESVYLPGRRSPYWQKFRHTKEADLVICGYQTGQAGRGLGSLVLGGNKDGKLVYQGKVGTGFSEREAAALLDALRKIEVAENGLIVPKEEKRRTRWVQPVFVCKIEFLNKTAEGCLRHPVYRGIRWDKQPWECGTV